MKKCLPVLVCLGIALASACSKKSKVTPVAPPPVVDPVKQDSTTPPVPPSPHIDTFLGSYVDSLFNDGGGFISWSDSVNIMFTVRYTDDNMVIFKSLQGLPVASDNTAPWIYYYAFSDTLVKSPTNTYLAGNNRFYTISGNSLLLNWTYDHDTYFRVSRCVYTGVKQ